MTKEEKEEAKRIKKEIKIQEKREAKELKKSRKEELNREKNVDKKISLRIKRENVVLKGPKIRDNRRKNEAPHLFILEEIGNSVSHGLGAIFAIIAMILMLLRSDTPLKITASLVYGFAMFFMFFNSCLYHSWRWGSKVKRLWRRFDYTSIYLLVAGTFAPLQLIELGFEYGNIGEIIGIIYFGVMWAISIVGITFSCVFGPGHFRKLHFTLYFVLGWSGLALVPGFLIHERFGLFFWILGGGIIYTLGMIPFGVLRGKRSAHFIWHLIVIAAVIAHFIGIYLFVY